MNRTISLAVPLLFASAVSAHAASFVLDFTGSGVVPDTYGDNAWADLSYRAIAQGSWGDVATLSSVQFWGSGYGDLDGALWGTPDPSHGEIKIEALNPSETVTIDSFDMGGWIADEAAEWRFYDLNWTLLGSGTGTAPDLTRLSVTTGASATGGVIFQWGLDAWDVGVENFAYSVSGEPSAVPLPASGLLLLGGLGLIGLRRRKN